MVQVIYNVELKKVLDILLMSLPGVRTGKMFGYPAYYVGKKLFACVYENGVGLKLPASQVTILLDGQTYTPFQPMGRHVMKEWVQINRAEPADYQLDEALFAASVEFVGKA
jgi:TfoX/Sxy family transcriptional regulator of competence genes